MKRPTAEIDRSREGRPPETWLTVEEVTARLGVRPETVYAYVSRGVLERRRAADGRRSLFAAGDVEQLARRGRPRLATMRATPIDVPIRTDVAGVDHGRLRYRGRPIEELVDGEPGRFERTLGLLWTGVPDALALDWASVSAQRRTDVGAAATVFERFVVVAALAATADPVRSGLDQESAVRAGQRLLPAFVAELGGDARPGRRPVATRLAGTLVGASDRRRRRIPRQDLDDLLDVALVLVADHELATSTMGVRVAASTRSDPYLCVVAGLATLSGPLHGSASRSAAHLLERVLDDGPDIALREALRTSKHVPAFGHVLYRHDDDPRAVMLLDRWRRVAASEDVRRVDRLIALVDDHLGVRPNVDLALGAVSVTLGRGAGLGEELFALGRTAGWIAHVAEEYGEEPLRFRPRRVAR